VKHESLLKKMFGRFTINRMTMPDLESKEWTEQGVDLTSVKASTRDEGQPNEVVAKEDDEEEDDQVPLNEDVYSLIFVEGQGSVYYYSISIVSLQIVIISLFYWDLIQGSVEGNNLNIPINVDTPITVAQLLAMPLAVMSHDDCTEAIYLLSRKYDPQILETHPNATLFSWRMALCARLFLGLLLIFMSFIQIMQATRLTDLFLNLEAIVFVGQLDNFAFWLAQKGFIKKEFQEAAEKVGRVTMGPTPPGWGRTKTRRSVMVGTFVVLIVGWITISMNQWRAVYLKAAACASLTVTFGDDVLSLTRQDIQANGTIRDYFNTSEGLVDLKYSYFSGTYRPIFESGNGLETYNEQRAIYYEIVGTNSSEYSWTDRGYFIYCDGSWIFKIDAVTNAFERKADEKACHVGWLMRSPKTEAFLLEEVPTEGWRVWVGDAKDGAVSDASSFKIRCDACDNIVDCNYHGECSKETKICKCDDEYLGDRCEIAPPCQALYLDRLGPEAAYYSKFGPFATIRKDGTLGSLKETTPSTELFLVYGRPVYAWSPNVTEEYDFEQASSSPEYQKSSGSWLIILYAGSRWYITVWDDFFVYPLFFLQDTPFHSFWNEVFQFGTLAFSGKTQSGTPIGVTEWKFTGPSRSKGDYGYFGAAEPYNLLFRCVEKSCPERLCGDYGVCTDGICTCKDCYGGRYCEYPYDGSYAGNAQSEGLIPENEYSLEFWSDPNTCFLATSPPVSSNVTVRP
jgi:hypothetical protein